MELRHLRYFVTVAEERNFTRAAERLHMAQPPLGQQIRKLEKELGVSLFHRTKRRVALTDAGSVFLEEARRTLRQAEQAARAAKAAGRGEAGRLAIGFVGSATYEVLPRVLRGYRGRYPDVALDLRQLSTNEQLRALRDGSIGVGLVRTLRDEPRDLEGIDLMIVSHKPLVAALPDTHPLASSRSVWLADLAEEAFILYPREVAPASYDRVLKLCSDAGFAPRVEQEASEMQTITGLVAARLGVSLVPGSVRFLRTHGIRYVPVEDETEPRQLAVVWNSGDASPILSGFLEVAGETTHGA